MVLLTVFTPTYNRAHTLPEAYCSLKAQTSKNFLWLIVDDGSTDRTAALVSAWMQAEKAFSIRYLYRPNGGMHAAHNTAYAHIETELNLCLDSDDRLAKDAVEQIEKRWAQIKSKNYAGQAYWHRLSAGPHRNDAQRLLCGRRQRRQKARVPYRHHPKIPAVPGVSK